MDELYNQKKFNRWAMVWNQLFFKSLSSKSIPFAGVCCLALTLSSFSSAPTSSSQEAYLLKRIAEYWKEGDYDTAKSQILHHLQKFPESTVKDSLHVMLGDLYMQEKNYRGALEQYNLLTEQEQIEKASYNKILCLYETKEYSSLVSLAEPFLPKNGKEKKQKETAEFLLAEALYRLGQIEPNEEQKTAYFEKSIHHYEHLIDSPYQEYCLQPLADLHTYIKDYPKASSYFSKLIQKKPQDRENLLFQTALLQTQYSPKEAIRTFGQVYKLRGKKAPDAAYNQLLLLFQAEQYKELLLFQEEALRHISEQKMPQVQYWIGKSLFFCEDYTQAALHLTQCLESKHLDDEQTANVLNTLTACAFKTKDKDLLKKMIEEWEMRDSSSQELASALLLQAQLHMRSDKDLALSSLEEVLAKFPDHKEKQSILYNCGVLLYQMNKWNESQSYFTQLTNEFPQTQFASSTWRYKINCAIEELKHITPETGKLKKEAFISLVQSALDNSKVLSNLERKEYHFHMIRTMFDLEQYQEVLSQLDEYLELYPKDPSIGEAHYLMALCYFKETQDHPLFISNAEKALLVLEDGDKDKLHLQLFNAYLMRTEQAPAQEKGQLLAKAADHLYQCYTLGKTPIKEDNLLWLSDYLYQRAKEQYTSDSRSPSSDEEAIERATALYEHALDVHKYPPTFSFSSDTLYLESEVMKLADLLGWGGRVEDKIDVLEALVYEQKNHTDLDWKLKRSALFELAKSYQEKGKDTEAIDTYGYLIDSSKHSSSYLALVSILERSKAELHQIAHIDRTEKNGQILQILDDLKDVEVRRKLYSEPLHIEAGLSYAELKASLVSKEERAERKLLLLEKLKESYAGQNDGVLKDYLSTKERYPEKIKQYLQYLKYIDAAICKTKAEIIEKQGDSQEAKHLLSSAQDLLHKLSLEESLPPELTSRIRTSTEATRN